MRRWAVTWNDRIHWICGCDHCVTVRPFIDPSDEPRKRFFTARAALRYKARKDSYPSLYPGSALLVRSEIGTWNRVKL